jgi:L-lysine exporter family protein LysE/ArgO
MLAIGSGLLTGLSLIIAIGAQNAFVLRQGLTRQHVLAVVLFCAVSDALLIVLGMLGLGVAIMSLPVLLEVFRFGGAAYLVYFAVTSFRRALRPQALEAGGAKAGSLVAALTTAAALTYLNPHVYIDTVLLLGSIGNQFGEDRWLFAFGAATGSLIWFFSLGFGAKLLSRFVTRPSFWKYLDISIGVVMLAIALMLLTYNF